MSQQAVASPIALEAEEKISRQFRLYPIQMIGLPLLIIGVLLACLGIFDELESTVEAETEDFQLRVSYPVRTRYGAANQLQVTVQNLKPQPLALVTVILEQSYIQSFTELHILPPTMRFTAQGTELLFSEIPPLATQTIRVELQAHQIGRRHSSVTATAATGTAIQTTIQTFILP